MQEKSLTKEELNILEILGALAPLRDNDLAELFSRRLHLMLSYLSYFDLHHSSDQEEPSL